MWIAKLMGRRHFFYGSSHFLSHHTGTPRCASSTKENCGTISTPGRPQAWSSVSHRPVSYCGLSSSAQFSRLHFFSFPLSFAIAGCGFLSSPEDFFWPGFWEAHGCWHTIWRPRRPFYFSSGCKACVIWPTGDGRGVRLVQL